MAVQYVQFFFFYLNLQVMREIKDMEKQIHDLEMAVREKKNVLKVSRCQINAGGDKMKGNHD